MTYNVYMNGKTWIDFINDIRFNFRIEVYKWNIKCPDQKWALTIIESNNYLTHTFKFSCSNSIVFDKFREYIIDHNLDITWD